MNIRVFRYLSALILLPALLGTSKTDHVNAPSEKDGTLIVGRHLGGRRQYASY